MLYPLSYEGWDVKVLVSMPATGAGGCPWSIVGGVWAAVGPREN